MNILLSDDWHQRFLKPFRVIAGTAVLRVPLVKVQGLHYNVLHFVLKFFRTHIKKALKIFSFGSQTSVTCDKTRYTLYMEILLS